MNLLTFCFYLLTRGSHLYPRQLFSLWWRKMYRKFMYGYSSSRIDLLNSSESRRLFFLIHVSNTFIQILICMTCIIRCWSWTGGVWLRKWPCLPAQWERKRGKSESRKKIVLFGQNFLGQKNWECSFAISFGRFLNVFFKDWILEFSQIPCWIFLYINQWRRSDRILAKSTL